MKPYQIAYSIAIAIIVASLVACADYPITGSIYAIDPGSGAKGGLVFIPGQKPTVSVKVPYYGENGELIGMLDVGTVPKPKVIPEK